MANKEIDIKLLNNIHAILHLEDIATASPSTVRDTLMGYLNSPSGIDKVCEILTQLMSERSEYFTRDFIASTITLLKHRARTLEKTGDDIFLTKDEIALQRADKHVFNDIRESLDNNFSTNIPFDLFLQYKNKDYLLEDIARKAGLKANDLVLQIVPPDEPNQFREKLSYYNRSSWVLTPELPTIWVDKKT